MYEELINSLRICGDWTGQVRLVGGDVCDGCKYQKYGVCESFKGNKELLLIEAADAIEKLSRIERDFRQYISDQVKRKKGVYACCYCKNRESANVYEPGCIHEKCDGVSGWQYGTPKEETE